MREAGNAELVLRALHPPTELDALVSVRLRDFGSARVGGGDEEREVVAALRGEEVTMNLSANSRGVCRVDCRNLIDCRT